MHHPIQKAKTKMTNLEAVEIGVDHVLEVVLAIEIEEIEAIGLEKGHVIEGIEDVEIEADHVIEEEGIRGEIDEIGASPEKGHVLEIEIPEEIGTANRGQEVWKETKKIPIIQTTPTQMTPKNESAHGRGTTVHVQ